MEKKGGRERKEGGNDGGEDKTYADGPSPRDMDAAASFVRWMASITVFFFGITERSRKDR